MKMSEDVETISMTFRLPPSRGRELAELQFPFTAPKLDVRKA